MPMKKLLAGLPKKGEVAFVHYYHEAEPGSDVVVRAKGLPFKANNVAVNFEDEGIMYTVRHVTDNFTHVVHISRCARAQDMGARYGGFLGTRARQF